MPERGRQSKGGAATLIERRAHVLWIDLKGQGGRGRLSGHSRALGSTPISLAEESDSDHAHTTPGELLAAAQSASFVATLADLLERRGKPARELAADSVCQIEDDGSGRRIVGLRLRVTGRGTGLDPAAFAESADAALACCPVSDALSAQIPISIEAALAGES
jgi:osmotically inducible protein OsmC